MYLCKSLCLRKNTLGEWDLIAAINGLRNDLAHRLNSAGRDKKFVKLKNIYLKEAADYPGIEEVRNESDTIIVSNACAHCTGFLSTFLADAKQFRRMIHSIDRNINPTLPAFDL
jgi:hypothetical protein